MKACVQAIDVLDQAGARVRLQEADGLRAARNLKIQLNAIEKELISAQWKNNSELANKVCALYFCRFRINIDMHDVSVILLSRSLLPIKLKPWYLASKYHDARLFTQGRQILPNQKNPINSLLFFG